MPKDTPVAVVDADTGKWVGGEIAVGEFNVVAVSAPVKLGFETIVAWEGDDDVCKLLPVVVDCCWLAAVPSVDDGSCCGAGSRLVVIVVVDEFALLDALFWNSWKSQPATSSRE